MKKIRDLQIRSKERLRDDYFLLKLTDKEPLPEMFPGQFVEINVERASEVFLRRPISINNYDASLNEMWLLIHEVGSGTIALGQLNEGDYVNCVFPLGKGFSLDIEGENILLVGGGVGTAPLLLYGKELKRRNKRVHFLLGGRSKRDLLQLDMFDSLGEVHVTTEDGSLGETGYVTNHSILTQVDFDFIASCGPKPMMKAVAEYAEKLNIECEVSLENLMACGLGACLCCVEKTTTGNRCVCKDGPVFNIKELLWHH